MFGAAFLDLLGRRAFAYVHVRSGPSKVVFVGVRQPF